MNLETAHNFVWDALVEPGLRITVQRLADEDLQPMVWRAGWQIEAAAGEYRDLELTLDLTGNLDAPL